jgi:hypothetical protein
MGLFRFPAPPRAAVGPAPGGGLTGPAARAGDLLARAAPAECARK